MNEPYKVIYSPQATDDLKNLYAYIAFERLVPEIAKNQVNRIRKAIRSLDFMPMKFPVVEWEPWHSMKMHKVPVDNFVVFYLIDSERLCVTIIRIIYSGRDMESIATSN